MNSNLPQKQPQKVALLVKESLRGGNEVDLVLVEDFPELIEAVQVVGDAVELAGDDDIDIAGADFPKEGLHSGSFKGLS